MSSALVSNVSRQQLGLEELRQLMRSVNETTERLESTHTALRMQVAGLQKELAEANARLRRSRTLAALGEMAAGIAHEVRNPLASIRLYAQMLGEDVAGDPPAADLCARITRAVDGLDAIVRDVLLFAKHTTIDPEPTTGRALLERAVESCAALIDAAGVEVTGLDDPADEALEADTCLVGQALSNLVRNAVQAMSEAAEERPRRLHLSVALAPRRAPGGRRLERVVITVRDTGPGIAPEVRRRMFNPFFTTRKTGTGLGLAIVHRIVEAHGGHVSVSDADGGGAQVEVCLPRRPPRGGGSNHNGQEDPS